MARSVSRKESKVHWLVIFSLAVVVRCVLSCRMPRKWESKRRLELPSPGPEVSSQTYRLKTIEQKIWLLLVSSLLIPIFVFVPLLSVVSNNF